MLTAVASYCEAKSQHGQWLVRIEDTDFPRSDPNSISHILSCLDAFSFEIDAPIIYQKDRIALYHHAITQLQQQNLVYACQCTRKILGSNAIYQGHCRSLNLAFSSQAIRVKVSDQNICFNDQCQGQHCSNLQHDLGDFVLLRRDGIVNYQLAVVVDDALQGITHVVRGADLLNNTARQIWLGQLLHAPQLQYMHLPLAMNKHGQKLSKQNLAKALNPKDAPQLLQQALQCLGQPHLDQDQPHIMLKQAISQWKTQCIPRTLHLANIYE